MRAARLAIFTRKIEGRGTHRGGEMRDARARRGKMVQGRKGVRSFSALVCSFVRTPRCPMPRVSYRRDMLGCNVVRCLRWLYAVCGIPWGYPRGLFGGAVGECRAGSWAYSAGVGHGAGLSATCLARRSTSSPCPQLCPSRRCCLRAASASSLPLLPPAPPSEACDCARCSPVTWGEDSLLSSDASLAVRPSPAWPRRTVCNIRPSHFSVISYAPSLRARLLLSCPSGS